MTLIQYFGSEFNCSWSAYDIEHGNDKPWLCHMPNVIGTIAVVIALGSMFTVLYNFATYVKENAKLRRSNSFDCTEFGFFALKIQLLPVILVRYK